MKQLIVFKTSISVYLSMPAKKKVHLLEVNLLPKDGFSQSSIGHFLEWSLTIGRYIVIFTEMVVILTFLQRFQLDRKISDINESLFTYKNYLTNAVEFEDEYRRIQQKAEFITELESQVNVVTVLNRLSSTAPSDIYFERLSVTNQIFSVDGSAFSQSSLESFVESLKQYEDVTDVNIQRIESVENSSAIEFGITIDFSKEESRS